MRKALLFFALSFLIVSNTVAQSGIITTIAGDGSHYYGGDGGPASSAQFSGPWGVAVDTTGNIYVSDYDNDVIRRINTAGIIRTFAGNHFYGAAGDGGPATAARLAEPRNVTIDDSGNVFIADYYNSLIRKVNTAGIISTYAGTLGSYGFSGDGGPATAAQLWSPISVAVDHAGNLYIADGSNHRVRMVNSAGIITTVAGNGTTTYGGDGGPATAAQLGVGAVAVDASGILYISDENNNRVRRVDAAGIITTIAGTGVAGYTGDGGPATAAWINGPEGLAFDNLGNLYFVDGLNHAIRKVTPSGIISTFAGNGIAGFSGDGGPATAAQLKYPTGVAVDRRGNVYIADLVNGRVRKVNCIMPVAGSIAGPSALCVGETITLTDTTSGGAWTTTNVHAVVTGGMVTGVTAGLDTIVYTVANACGTATVSRIITVNPLPDAGIITGPSIICGVGALITLSDAAVGGVWSVSNANAVIGLGMVIGSSFGMDTVSYIVTNSCGSDTATAAIDIHPLPNAGVITGAAHLCGPGATITLADTAAAGVWTSGNTNASVLSGVVTALAYGTDTISYAVTNSCGTAVVHHAVAVYPATAGAITGIDSVCVGFATTLVNAIPGGHWNTSGGQATVSSTGIVTGTTTGSATIHYTISNACGTFDASFPIAVVDASSCWGVGVAEVGVTDNQLAVYPNPSNGNCYILFTSASRKSAQVVIYGLLGQPVANFTALANERIEIKNKIPAGVYLVTATTQDERLVTRMVITE